jgi:hypothetical protein
MSNHRDDVSGVYGPAHPRQGPVEGREEVARCAAATTTAHGPATDGGPLHGAALQHVAAVEAEEASAIYQLVAAEFPMGISSPLRKGQGQQPTVGSALGRFAVPLAHHETPSGMADLAASEGSPVLPVQGDAPGGDSGCSKLYDPAAGSLSPASGGTPEIPNHPASPGAALADSNPEAGRVKPNRQARDPEGRHCRIYVRVTEDERARIEARAAASGVTAPRLLVELALLGPAGATERHAINTAMLGVRRQIVGMATNINQLAKWANAREQLPPSLDSALASIGRMEAHVAAVLEALGDHAKSQGRGRNRRGDRPTTSSDA